MRGTAANTAHEAAGETVASYADVWRDSNTEHTGDVARGGAPVAGIVATSYTRVARGGVVADTDAATQQVSLAAQKAVRNRRAAGKLASFKHNTRLNGSAKRIHSLGLDVG